MGNRLLVDGMVVVRVGIVVEVRVEIEVVVRVGIVVEVGVEGVVEVGVSRVVVVVRVEGEVGMKMPEGVNSMDEFKIGNSFHNQVIGSVTKDLKFSIEWNGSKIEMNNIEEAKTVSLILWRLIFEKMEHPK